jgi:hypothetical protein
MFYFISLVTSVKDYIEIAHKLVESDVTNFSTYNDLGALFSYLLFSFKQIFTASNLWNLPIIIPDVASALISEVSILDTNWQNQIDLQLFSERSPFAAREIGNNIFREGVEKFSLGFINSFFIWLPTSVSHVILLRRFAIQGIEAGYLAGMGIIAGNILWISSILLSAGVRVQLGNPPPEGARTLLIKRGSRSLIAAKIRTVDPLESTSTMLQPWIVGEHSYAHIGLKCENLRKVKGKNRRQRGLRLIS